MIEFFKDFFTVRDAFARSMRGLGLAVAAAALTPEGQAALAGIGGTYAFIVPVIAGLLTGGIAVGEKNKEG